MLLLLLYNTLYLSHSSLSPLPKLNFLWWIFENLKVKMNIVIAFIVYKYWIYSWRNPIKFVGHPKKLWKNIRINYSAIGLFNSISNWFPREVLSIMYWMVLHHLVLYLLRVSFTYSACYVVILRSDKSMQRECFAFCNRKPVSEIKCDAMRCDMTRYDMQDDKMKLQC